MTDDRGVTSDQAIASAERAPRCLVWALGTWAVGVQVSEAVATVGMIATLVAVLAVASTRAQVLSRERLQRDWALLLFLGWALLGPTLATRWPTGTGVARLLDWAFLPFAAVAFSALRGAQRTRLVSVACGVAVLSCGAALLQHFGWWPAPEHFAAVAWTRIPFYRMYEPITGAPGRFMAGGLLWHRLKFAHVEGLVAIVTLTAGLVARGRRRAALLGVAAVVFVSVLLFPYARAAVVALAIALGVAVVLVWPDRRRAVLVAGALACLALAVVGLTPSLRARFLTSNTDEGNGDRHAFRAAALRALADHPISGVGAGRFRPSLYADASTPVQVLEHPGKAHLQWLSIATELGIPGALLFTVLMIQLLARMRSSGHAEGDVAARAGSAAGRAAIAFFVLLSLFHDPLFHSEFSMALVLVLGASLGACDPRWRARNTEGTSR